MKKLLFAVLAASLSLSVFGYDIFSYVPINGNAKTYTCTEYSVASKFGDYFRTPIGKVVHTLDSAAKDVETAEYTPRDALIVKIQNVYDSKGNVTTQTGYSSADEVIWKTVSSYKNGKKADESQYGKDNTLKGKTIFTYDGNLLTEETGYDGNGVLIWKTVFKYDDMKRIATESEYFADGSLSEERNYSYAESGAIESISTMNTIDGYKKEVFRYSSSGQLNEITVYGTEKVTQRLILKYDSQGNVVRISDYNVAEKFGTTVNELVYMAEYTYTY